MQQCSEGVSNIATAAEMVSTQTNHRVSNGALKTPVNESKGTEVLRQLLNEMRY